MLISHNYELYFAILSLHLTNNFFVTATEQKIFIFVLTIPSLYLTVLMFLLGIMSLYLSILKRKWTVRHNWHAKKFNKSHNCSFTGVHGLPDLIDFDWTDKKYIFLNISFCVPHLQNCNNKPKTNFPNNDDHKTTSKQSSPCWDCFSQQCHLGQHLHPEISLQKNRDNMRLACSFSPTSMRLFIVTAHILFT